MQKIERSNRLSKRGDIIIQQPHNFQHSTSAVTGSYHLKSWYPETFLLSCNIEEVVRGFDQSVAEGQILNVQ